ncbi:MAG: YjbE family integral membrane protein [Hyphomicrobiaceae bacterium]|jgi:YjbE family integral membrane protein
MFELLFADFVGAALAQMNEVSLLSSPEWWRAHYDDLIKVFLIDVTLAGDNAIVVGLAAAQVAPEIRNKVIFWGIAAAVILRIFFAAITQQLLAIVGLTLAGGVLLAWVCWKMYREISESNGAETLAVLDGDNVAMENAKKVSFWAAVGQITLADLSMSLDNVLAVAGAAGESQLVLIIGLGLAIVLMAVAAHFIARLLVTYPWIAWLGLLMIVWVAADMIYRGGHEVTCQAWSFGCSEDLYEAIRHRLGL